MTATLIQKPDRVLLQEISWQTYQLLVKDFEKQPAIRLTYDKGWLEIRMPLDPHETYKKLIGRLVEALTEELEIEIRSLGSRTCDREDFNRGLEPDQCYYIKNESLVWGKGQIDLSLDPPPDLAIEIDITRSSLDRLSIYASLGVPEVWRYDGKILTMYALEGEKYQSCRVSPAFPFLNVSDLQHFLELSKTMKENALIRSFREWTRQKNEQ
ncbi:MAG: Uma2 family endonuclease [Cyanobacteriota bacterium]|nr:Uma2 family endonuclease [Cyanobacteriota bacterium]